MHGSTIELGTSSRELAATERVLHAEVVRQSVAMAHICVSVKFARINGILLREKDIWMERRIIHIGTIGFFNATRMNQRTRHMILLYILAQDEDFLRACISYLVCIFFVLLI